MRALTFASMDTPGPYETVAKEAFFNVTLPEKDWTPEHVASFMGGFNRGTVLSTAIHEAYPGHYVQFLWMQHVNSSVRKLLGANSNAEGWAHYCEQMMFDEGVSDRIRACASANCRTPYCATRAISWASRCTPARRTFDQGVEFFEKEGYQTHETALMEKPSAALRTRPIFTTRSASSRS